MSSLFGPTIATFSFNFNFRYFSQIALQKDDNLNFLSTSYVGTSSDDVSILLLAIWY